MQEEIQLLRQKLKETEMAADQDRFLKVKLSEDSTNLARENAALNQQMIDLKKQLERVGTDLNGYSINHIPEYIFYVWISSILHELIFSQEKAYREATESRQNQSISEYVQIKDREKEARFELQHSQEALKREQDKVKSLMEQVIGILFFMEVSG